MKKFILTFLIFSIATVQAAVGSWNGAAFTAWNGVAQTAWNGSSISCASGGGGFPSGAVAHWHLNEASGNRVDAIASISLAENGGTINSGTGIIGNAANFVAASSQFLSVADNATLSTDGDISFSWAVWTKLNTDSSNQPILNKGFEVYAEIYIEYNAGADTFKATVADNLAQTVTASNAGVLTAGNWYLVVVVYDAAADTLSIRVNNNLTPNTTTISGGNTSSPGTFRIGLGPGPIYLNGLVDEVTLWKKALSTQEQTDLYNAGAGRDYP